MEISTQSKEPEILYTGYFVENPNGLQEKVPIQLKGDDVTVFAHHITRKFQPDNKLEDVNLGRIVTVTIFGQVVTDRIQAVLVRGSDEEPLASQNDFPHITMATAGGAMPFESNQAIADANENGTIVYFDEPIEIKVVEGYSDGHTTYTS